MRPMKWVRYAFIVALCGCNLSAIEDRCRAIAQEVEAQCTADKEALRQELAADVAAAEAKFQADCEALCSKLCLGTPVTDAGSAD